MHWYWAALPRVEAVEKFAATRREGQVSGLEGNLKKTSQLLLLPV